MKNVLRNDDSIVGNPINKVPTMKVFKWEYAELVSAANTLSILTSMVRNGKEYEATGLLKLLLKEEERKIKEEE